MKAIIVLLAMLALGSGRPGLAPPGPSLPISSFIVTNNSIGIGPNTGTMLALQNDGLVNVQTFETGGTAQSGGFGGLNEVITVANGPNACIYLSDAYSDDIAGFIYSSAGLAKVGNFTGPGGTGEFAIGLAARGTTLVSAYSLSGVLAVWSIQSDCSLTLESMVDNETPAVGLAISPDGKTVTVAYDCFEVDSYSLQPDGTLVEHGPYASISTPDGGDITPDGRYAIFAEFEDVLQKATAVAIYPIHADGSLGSPTNFTDLGPGGYSESVSLSPDAKYLYVSDNVSAEVVSLAFSEDPINVTPVWHQRLSGITRRQGHITVISNSGNMYVATALSGDVSSAVNLFQAYSNGHLTQVPNSPFVVDAESGGRSLAAWPPRGF